jgi:hypothetical protein
MKKLSGFLGFCLALLLPVVAFAQGATPSVQIITGKGTTGPLFAQCHGCRYSIGYPLCGNAGLFVTHYRTRQRGYL